MRIIEHSYIDGRFVEPHGRELFDLHNPATGAVIGRVRLGDADDVDAAVAAAKRALPGMARTGKAERLQMLDALHSAMRAHVEELREAVLTEYGAPVSRSSWMADYAADTFVAAARTLADYPLQREIGTARVVMAPVGVVGLITPWNSNAGFICNKLAYAIAAGCTAVIKPSEMSAMQTEMVLRALHEAGLPAGVYNVVNGSGADVGAAITAHPDVAKISFTGSTAVGKAIVQASAASLKRVTLELGGKSPTIILDDADLDAVIPGVIEAGFMNSGQACIAGTRVLVSEHRRADFEALLKAAIETRVKVGDPRDPATTVGPMVSQTQWERVQRYIRLGQQEGARLLTGGEGRPDGLSGYFVRPTVFTDVSNDMKVAREEIFGPVLAILSYRDEDEAVAIANDTSYGLSAYVFGDPAHAERIAARIDSGRVVINGAAHEPLAPFGGMKQSGLGRENGPFGLEAYLEPKTLLGARAA
ncbi:aldehyde dehydrogenase family protein [Bradyrhizobium sp. CCBAU 51753]|uniref:aldehyde dehydrogenase family protein n=1 Tax=Bradyrhizobium sp. CCBAU 51753 TaxID=1325100 RepID=UPI00188C31E0|nr:aldehyde dehydrogenase family protein [Bradyrhizobium sp. CCBAU 51753]QOZ28333.1 aldehyde dehydrogenase family protein [Bradyrhizobium sp. CCBAU 51753]